MSKKKEKKATMVTIHNGIVTVTYPKVKFRTKTEGK